jgi:glycine reductase complex component B subunit gamma
MAEPVRVVHYINQFFAGLGSEEAANRSVEVHREPIGATRGLIAELGASAIVVGTIVAGDNYMNDERDAARAAVRAALAALRPHVVVAGPAFEAGRYGLACAEVCRVAIAEGIPAVTAMHPAAPAVALHGRDLVIVPTGPTAADMPRALSGLARLAVKLARGEALGPAESEGYLPRGGRRSGLRGAPGFLRALDMLEAKLGGRAWTSEIPYQAPDRVAPAAPVRDLARTEIALVTTGGLVPKGNPDGQTSGNAQRYFRYPIDQLQALRTGEWEAYHVGYFTHLVDRNPNYVLPLGYMRELEKAGEVGAVHRYAYTLPGVSTPVATARRLGEGIAAQLRDGQVGGCLLVST